MKLLIQTIFILVIFFKTGNLLSDNNLFTVNNIFIETKGDKSSKQLANQAIKKGFDKLVKRILLKEDISKISGINFSNIKELIKYYNISKNIDKNNYINFSVTFDKDKIHNLLLKNKILYAEIYDKDFFVLPVLIKENDIDVFSNNFFYQNWNKESKQNNDELLEFILPIENIEIIQKINQSRKNLLDLNLDTLLNEYPNKNVGLILIDASNQNENKVYLKNRIENKILSKNLIFRKDELNLDDFKKNIIFQIKNEIINLVKFQNLIDVKTPSFLNVKYNLDDENNLVFFNSKIKNIDLIEGVYVQEFNLNHVNIKIKYLGKFDKLKNQFKLQNIDLKYVNDEWLIKVF